ncbi:hypothetical protein [Flavonifractor sp. An306]|uniref:hypothetical protein n=1 Tax=Flavonifractor sp. An306 TaxID=1965629 RepID=UPI000B377E93|nr:hypothetical protein [Flavonifractor sp. An306]OUO31955.1 hypothetical protein B5F88_17535 [Flavonifractor sp. An306]
MKTIELARKLAEYKQVEDAQKAYTLVLGQEEKTPEEEMEAASYIFFSQGEYQVAYTTFVSLYNRGHFQAELLDLMTQAFYLPNVKEQRRCYRENCEHFKVYPYLFRKGFPDFDQLPIQFFPFDDKGFIPFYRAENRFGAYVNFNDTVIDRNFFSDLENPILAKDVYSQYQLEYLNDNVRKSEWVGRENHIYLHYTNWDVFCAYLQCLNFVPLLKEEKLVFLMEEEVSQYPIDFQARFGIDYSKYPLKPVHVREINRLIWHTQLAAHNGGDFFNEIFHNHPNLISLESVMFDEFPNIYAKFRRQFKRTRQAGLPIPSWLKGMQQITDKDALLGMMMGDENCCRGLDRASRIVPAIFLQPHFRNIIYKVEVTDQKGTTLLSSEQYDQIHASKLFQSFKYIKTFTPMRRITTSYAATIRFMEEQLAKELTDDGKPNLKVGSDVMMERLKNRSFMIDPQDRLYHDSVLVRFEDGKLNPKATFTALAKFLDIPYTESMTYCSGKSGLNPESLEGNVLGFDAATVYRTYDEYANDEERAFLEYFLRDAYECYGYDFHYYKGESVDANWIRDKIEHFSTLNAFITGSRRKFYAKLRRADDQEPMSEEEVKRRLDERLKDASKERYNLAIKLQEGLRFVNKNGQPLRLMTPLKLDPALLENPLYH